MLFFIKPFTEEPFLVSSNSHPKLVPIILNESQVKEGKEVNQQCTHVLRMGITKRYTTKLTYIKGTNSMLTKYIEFMIDKKNV